MDQALSFIEDMERSIALAEKKANSIPRRGMMVYLDKTTPVMVQYTNDADFQKAKSVSSRKGSSSCLRNVIDAGGRLQ